MEQYMILDIINQITKGSLRIPSFQRDFVWEPENVAFFMDSLYKKFPVGSILIWRTEKDCNVSVILVTMNCPNPKKNIQLIIF